MKRFLLGVLICLAASCGSDSPSAPSVAKAPAPAPAPAPTPIAAAQLAVPTNASFGSSDCDARRSLGASIGLAIISGCHFTGTLENLGPGCAGNIHGTTTITETGGASSWTIPGAVARPQERLTYSGGPVSLPTTAYHYQTQFLWDNVRCQ